LAPGWFPDYSSIARFCNDRGAFDLALQAAMTGLEHAPHHPLLHLRVAQSYDGLGQFERAVERCRMALALDPVPDVAAQTYATMALAYESAGDVENAVGNVLLGIETSPECVEPRVAYAGILGRSGAYAEAWRELEFFFIEERAWFRRRFGRPEWNGEEIAGRRLLVVHGQGVGDLVQMARYLPALRERAAEVALEVPPALHALAESLEGIRLVPKDRTPLEAVDVFCRAMALPRILGETGVNPAPAYLHAPADRVARWTERLGERRARRRVGLAWAGNPYHSSDHLRSLTLAAFERFAQIGDVEWVSLQVGPRGGEPAPAGMDIARFADDIRDFADTAAIASACDLVISIDTSVAHLAGATGTPVWVLLPARPEWRWPRAAAPSPWYRSMQLVHADRYGWAAALDRAAEALGASGG
jgi:tetratricopeptide (TPR) repeat protein